MSRKTPPFPEYEKWTTSRFWTFIRSALRRAWTKWPPKYNVMAKAKRPAQYEWWNENNRKLNVKYEYQCAACKEWYMGKEVSVDHIDPVGKLNSYEDLPKFVERLFVAEDKLQVLCHTCHDLKTKQDRNNGN